MFESLSFLGFGYLTLGTVTVSPREGNPKPRIWRFANDSLINSMGLPNQGADKIRERLSGRQHNRRAVPIALSISGLSLDDFFDCYLKLELCADVIELNISTPNTSGVRIFQDPMTFEQLLDGILSKRRTNKPIWVKIPPYFDEKTRENVLELVNICRRKSVNAVTAINTKPVKEPRASIGTAGVSGKEIFGDMLRIVRDIYTDTDGKISINACGGIQSAKNAWSALLAGATTIQLYTGLIYQGPGLVAHVNRGIYKLLEKSGFKSIHELTGTERS
jgi:dihydroorotate dehydrogenase